MSPGDEIRLRETLERGTADDVRALIRSFEPQAFYHALREIVAFLPPPFRAFWKPALQTGASA